MKRLILYTLSFVAGLTGGSTIRFTQHWKAGYRHGCVVAIDDFQREAVREGHGHWERAGDAVEFRWNETRFGYSPNSTSHIPGLE